MDTQQIPQWTISDRLVKARDWAGMTQDDIAEALDMSRRTVVRHEHATDPPRWFLLAYAEITGVPIEWLLDADIDIDTDTRSRCIRESIRGAPEYMQPSLFALAA